jgi:Subtilase family
MTPWIAILVFFLMVTSGNAQSDRPEGSAKLNPSLLRLQERYASHLAQRGAIAFSSQDPLIRLVQESVVIDAVAERDVNSLMADLVFLGMTDAVAFGRTVSGHLPISSIPALAALTELRFAQPAAAISNVGSVTSQGDQAMRSNVARSTFGVDGTGVKVGVLSDSFNCLGGAGADFASGDLSPVTVLQEEPGCASGTDEGRAMLQIVHDVAPGASLAFATAFAGQASFANNIVALKNQGTKVIVDDVIYFAEPMFQDGVIAQAVDNVVSEGVTYFSSAGNAARQSYQSAFRAGDSFASAAIPSTVGAPAFLGGTAHNFDAGTGKDHFQSITLPPGTTLIISLQWDSRYFSVSGAPGTQNNLDLYVLDSLATVVVAGTTFNNVGGDPIEIFGATNNGTSALNLNLMIVNRSGPNPGVLKYVYFFSGLAPSINEHDTQSSTVFGHANAGGALAVGAAAYFNTTHFGVSPPVLNSFSSRGGTPIMFDLAGTRLAVADPRADKPEIVAPDGTDTTFFGTDTDGNGFPNFFGTSAAAPHAAAVAALLRQRRPSITPAELHATLTTTAIDMGTPGFDSDSGFGLIQADAALAISPDGLINISTRGLVRTGDNVMIGGFVIEGSVAKTVLIRARGPSMGGAPFSLQGTLTNPLLRIFSGSTNIARNDNWETTDPLCASMGFVCGGPAEIAATGMDPCNSNPGQSTSPPGCERESAILITLPPAAYTAIVSGSDGGIGIGLVEVYEVDGGASSSKLINISTRGSVETNDNVLIGGLIIGGNAPKTILVRGRGPSMGGAPFVVPGTVANPFLRLFSGSALIAQNDDWGTSDPLCGNMGFICGGAVEITATGSDPCQPNPGQSTPPAGCAQEASILITLPPGAYTAIVNGVAGTTGIGLVETFEIN